MQEPFFILPGRHSPPNQENKKRKARCVCLSARANIDNLSLSYRWQSNKSRACQQIAVEVVRLLPVTNSALINQESARNNGIHERKSEKVSKCVPDEKAIRSFTEPCNCCSLVLAWKAKLREYFGLASVGCEQAKSNSDRCRSWPATLVSCSRDWSTLTFTQT